MVKEKKSPFPVFPSGIAVREKPDDIEFYTRGDGKWVSVVQALKLLEATESVTIDIAGNNKWKNMLAGIKGCAKRLGFDKKIKYATKSDTLYLWTNK